MTPTDTDHLDRVIHRLHQASTWASWGDNGRLLTQRLDDMTPAHLRSVLAWLRDRAVALHAEQLAHHHRELSRDRDYFDTLADIAHLQRTPPGHWLDETPLVRRLAQLVPHQPAPRRGLLRRWRR
ncbi:hypothetical protein [Pseudonocardia broussonetiae]|uniref:Uncharacterized protein n=1 Tax=Pseudonocardia broussonetiae TaxID=2736640 RepID=A0A6M6JGS4_9PSEU|nr:hypothetical protein [Pseudonocardia broussonetiae]QJY46686.1 hypothetical protein HOP40_13360 [Pseudonocardia broussonetiae]